MRCDGSLGVSEEVRASKKPIAAQSEKPVRVVPQAGSKRVAKGRRPKGRDVVRVRVRRCQVDFWKPGALLVLKSLSRPPALPKFLSPSDF